MNEFRYGFDTELHDTSFPVAVGRTVEALKAEGFGVLTEIDVRKTLKQKLDEEYHPYVILGACNPPLAHKALKAEAQIGLLLPCNVVVQKHPERGVVVSVADPKALFELVDNSEIQAVADEVSQRLERALASLD